MALAKHQGISAQPLAVRVYPDVIDRGIECAGEEEIVAVYEAKPVAGSAIDSLIEGIYLATVLFADPPGKPVLVPLDNIQRVVRAATIDHNILDVGVPLVEHRKQGLLEKAALIVRRSY